MILPTQPPRCDARLWDQVDGVRCTREPHDGGGHVYVASRGLPKVCSEPYGEQP